MQCVFAYPEQLFFELRSWGQVHRECNLQLCRFLPDSWLRSKSLGPLPPVHIITSAFWPMLCPVFKLSLRPIRIHILDPNSEVSRGQPALRSIDRTSSAAKAAAKHKREAQPVDGLVASQHALKRRKQRS